MASNGLSAPAESSGHAGPSTSGFKSPANPAIPQDLSIIMEMVAQHQVVGSLPTLGMTAAEKRKLVEASLAKGKEKSKTTELAPDGAHTASSNDMPDSDSDSSSEWESSEEEAERALEMLEPEEGELAASRTVEDHPMTEAEHDTVKKELVDLIGPPPSSSAAGQPDEESSDDSSSEEEFEDEAEGEQQEFEFSSSPLPTPKLGRMVEIMDEEEDPHAGDPILSLHEVPLPPVPQPPMTRLPEGEKVSLAGDVISWMREKRVEAWLEKEARKAVAQSEEPIQAEVPQEASEAIEEAANEATEVYQVKELPSTAQPAESAQPNRATLVDSWTPSGPSTTTTASSVQGVPDVPPAESSSSASKVAGPRFTSAGTVVVRAMQSRAGAADEGWLEEGSVICWEDGRVLGTVSETFGPLTSPFYQIRLPPPPHPYPSADTLSSGTRLFYPLNPKYRTFVNMHAVRDPRFKGSDASNLYDEEIGEDEMEWSDDEAEAEAKRRRKQRRATGSATPGPGGDRGWEGRSDAGGRGGRGGRGGGRGGTASRAGSTAGGHPSLPQRPHFDYQPDDASDFGDGSIYGDDARSERWEGSDAGSSASGRPRPMPYDDDVVMAGGRASVPAAAGLPPRPSGPTGGERRDDRGTRGGSGGGRGRGGQGRDRGRGRGGTGGGRDDRRAHHPHQHQQPQGMSGGQGQAWQPPSPGFQQQQNAFQSGPPGMGYPQPYPMPQFPQHNFNYQPQQQAYNPSQPFPQYPYQQGPPPQFAPPSPRPPQGAANGDGIAPAINPRFAAQMQMMMGQMPPMGGPQNWGQ